MLNFLLKLDKKTIMPYMLTWQQYGKQIRLQRPAQAIVGHAAHGQRRQHDANAEVSGHQQAVFSLWRPH